MVRRFQPEKKKRFRPLYWLFVLVVAAAWFFAFKAYFQRYEYLHPDITWAVPGIDNDTEIVNGVLLWTERVFAAPADGTVSYPQGGGPVRVAKGAVVARVAAGGKNLDIKATQQGYFVAGVDGLENSWRYADLWPGTDLLPQTGRIELIKNGTAVSRGQAVGKLIEQPQDLRFIGYATIMGNMESQIKGKSLKVKMDEEDTDSRAEIRVYNELPGGKVKLHLTLPWFQPSVVMSRAYRLVIEAGSSEGAIVPYTALLEKNGEIGVYLIRGSRVIFKPVEGKYIGDGKFIVRKGLSVGDAVVEDASTAREGRIQLW